MKNAYRRFGFTLVEILMACVALGVLMIPLFMLMNMGTRKTIMNKQEILVHAYASSILNFIASQGKVYWDNRIKGDGKYKLEPPLIQEEEVAYKLDDSKEHTLKFTKPEGVKFKDDECYCEIKTLDEGGKKRYKIVSVNVAWVVPNLNKTNSIRLSELVQNEN